MQQIKYAGAGVRFKAWVLDVLLLLPLIVLQSKQVNRSIAVFACSVAAAFGVSVYLFVFCPKKYGGSPGKRLMKIRILTVNGKKIGIKEAVLRTAVQYFLSAVSVGTFLYAAFSKNISLTQTAAAQFLETYGSVKNGIIDYVGMLWFLIDILMIIVHKNRRSLKDVAAGTIVVFDEKKQPCL